MRMARTAIAAATFAAAFMAPAAHANAADGHRCTFTFSPATPVLVNGAVVVGGYAECHPAPDEFRLRLRLSFRPRGGDWVVRDLTSTTVQPNPYANVAVRDLECVPGVYRGEYDMAEASGGSMRVENHATSDTILC